MIITDLLKNKKIASNNFKKQFNFLLNNNAIGYLFINNKSILLELLDALATLPANFVVVYDGKVDNVYSNIALTNGKINNLIGFDFVICDDCESSMTKFFSAGVVPIVSKDHHISSLLSEFNAAKITGNGYIFKNTNKWEIFYAIIRYLENYKFPYDNKALVKNVLEI